MKIAKPDIVIYIMGILAICIMVFLMKGNVTAIQQECDKHGAYSVNC